GHTILFFHSGRTIRLKRRVTKLGYPGVEVRLNMPFGRGSGHPVIRFLAFPFLFVSTMIQLLWLLRKREINLVNLHYLTDDGLYFAICRYLLPIRLVTSVHGRDAFYQEQPKSRYSLSARFVLRSSDLIVLPSKSYRDKLLTAFPHFKDKTIFIHNGINPTIFKPADVVRSTNGAERYLLCVAELQEYKAIDVLLQAAKPLLASDRSLSLVLAGDGPLRSELENLASGLGITDQTRFLGTRGATEIVSLLRSCETLVLPSRMEPFGIALIEAMACRAPVVATT